MSEPNPIKTERRRARQRAKLPPDAACVLCGETTPEALLLVERCLVESHHVLGEGIAPELTLPLCLNCHRVETEGQLAVGVGLRREPRPLPEVLVSVLRSLGTFLQALGARMLVWAEQLAALITALDAHHPGWRQLPEARA